MSKRIKELAEQAWSADCLEENPQWEKNAITDFLLEDMATFHQKFAKLVIQDCINTLHDNELWSRHVSHALEEHFWGEK